MGHLYWTLPVVVVVVLPPDVVVEPEVAPDVVPEEVVPEEADPDAPVVPVIPVVPVVPVVVDPPVCGFQGDVVNPVMAVLLSPKN